MAPVPLILVSTHSPALPTVDAAASSESPFDKNAALELLQTYAVEPVGESNGLSYGLLLNFFGYPPCTIGDAYEAASELGEEVDRLFDQALRRGAVDRLVGHGLLKIEDDSTYAITEGGSQALACAIYKPVFQRGTKPMGQFFLGGAQRGLHT